MVAIETEGEGSAFGVVQFYDYLFRVLKNKFLWGFEEDAFLQNTDVLRACVGDGVPFSNSRW